MDPQLVTYVDKLMGKQLRERFSTMRGWSDHMRVGAGFGCIFHKEDDHRRPTILRCKRHVLVRLILTIPRAATEDASLCLSSASTGGLYAGVTETGQMGAALRSAD